MSMIRRTFQFRAMLLLSVTAVISAQTNSDHAHVLELLHNGRDAAQRGDLPNAEMQFAEAVQSAPDLSDAYLGLGLVQIRRGELDPATKTLLRAVALNPRLPGANLFLGIAQYQLGEIDAATASLRSELDLQPNSVEALTWLGIVELGQEHPELATTPLDRATALNPKDERVLYYTARAHMLVAEADYRRLSELDPDSAFVHRGMAESFTVAGQPEKAIIEYEAAIRRDPKNPDLYEALGNANLKMSRVDAAKVAFEEELKINPGNPIALYNLGKMDVERGKPESGVFFLRKAQSAHASPAPTAYYLGLGLAELGQNQEAAQWLEVSLKNSPSAFVQQGAWYQLARVYPKLNRRADAQHALAELKTLLQKAEAQKELTATKVPRGADVESRSGTSNDATHP